MHLVNARFSVFANVLMFPMSDKPEFALTTIIVSKPRRN
jgi:hypothetical protein